eukprot:CAMPEP_0198286182 /NCGR_PEP_ID=MMETSP1449-20131203/5324_1 /TAXON_ID=420275 /ORGANISM="Attheya septentrionalis, Strain CCMP2084" /LENGTH=575 /DNA_ID=CAMNT_0043983841 /DNA_START=141 /DNA_END=1868 /DNA_ORIENTATION=-
MKVPFALHLLLCGFCFSFGTLWGMHMSLGHTPTDSGEGGGGTSSISGMAAKLVESLDHSVSGSRSHKKRRRIPDTMSNFALGMGRVAKSDFMSHLDTGMPGVDERPNAKDIMILYNNKKSLPDGDAIRAALEYETEDGDIPRLTAVDALANCHKLNIILTKPDNGANQCIAIVPNYESFYIQRYTRVGTDKTGIPKGPMMASEPLRFTGRAIDESGHQTFTVPNMGQTTQHWQRLQQYMTTLDDMLTKVRRIAGRVAVDNTIVVLTCNLGQSELLLNFCCTARARGFDLKNVLVFTTDEETERLAKAMGLESFYDKDNFEWLPSDEARNYGDKSFTAMMFAKILCVRTINMLGYNLLFQDVDVVWYRNPLELFQNNTNTNNFDIIFQDDGARSFRFAPYSANSGFYYVRANARTKYFFTSQILLGDMVLRSNSHQDTMTALLNQHATLHGLRVKTMDREANELPCGFHYHRRKEFMMQMVQGNTKPYIFHMSWTNNKKDKIKFFQQLGNWHLQDTCSEPTFAKTASASLTMTPGELVTTCCTAEPNFKCHYSDKPSIRPCKDSPKMEKKDKSFWP